MSDWGLLEVFLFGIFTATCFGLMIVLVMRIIFADEYKKHDLIQRGVCCYNCKNTEFKSLTNHRNKFYCEKCYEDIKEGKL